MNHCTVIAFSGTDERSQAAAQALSEYGYHIQSCPTHEADIIILPLGESGEALRGLHPGQLVLGGHLGENAAKLSASGCRVIDYYEDNILQAFNALPTAEGAIGILIDKLPITVQGMRCLVIGYGQIGSVLSSKLAQLGAHVTVSARKDSDIGRILAMGLRPDRTCRYQYRLGDYDAIVNTVPAPVLSEADYTALKSDCLLLELASLPGGFNPSVCRRLGLNYICAPGLPGKIAPITAGYAIADAIRRILILEESSCDMKP